MQGMRESFGTVQSNGNKRTFKIRYGMSMRQFRTRPSQAAHAAPTGDGYAP